MAKWAHTTPTCPPIGLAYIAGALIEDGYQVDVIDAVGEAPDQMLPSTDSRFLLHGLCDEEIILRIHQDTQVVGISCMFSHEWPVLKVIIDGIKKKAPQAQIIAGGEHISAMPEFCLQECLSIDIGVIGEGEEIILNILKTLEDTEDLMLVPGIVLRQGEQITRTLPQARNRAIDDIAKPSWEAFPLSAYLDNGYGFGVNLGRSMPVMATRGCPYQCTFCSNKSMWTTRWIARNVQTFFDELKGYHSKYRIDNYDFYDLTAIVKKDWVVEFCSLIKQSGMTFTWQLPSGTRSEAIDAEVASMLFESGCRNLSYAPESGSPEVLTRIKKKVDLATMLKSMRSSVVCGLNVKANIIIGFPGETHKNAMESIWFIGKMAAIGIHDVSISPFSPYPGSELFNDLTESGRIGEFTNDYFYSLAAYTDIFSSVSYSEHISDKALTRYRLCGMAFFYLVSFVIRPLRPFKIISNLIRGKQESRLEMSLNDLVTRLRS